MKYPKLSGRRFIRKYLQEHWGRLRLEKNSEIRELITPLLKASSSTGCTFFELNSIYRQVLRQKPAHILELGSGISTVFLAHAAKRLCDRGYKTVFISMEENEAYWSELNELFPAELRNYVNLRRSDVEDVRYLGWIGRRYVDKPHYPYTFVFIDGPAVPRWKHNASLFNADILDVLIDQTQPVIAKLDHRILTRNAIELIVEGARIRYDKQHEFSHIVFPVGAFQEREQEKWIKKTLLSHTRDRNKNYASSGA